MAEPDRKRLRTSPPEAPPSEPSPPEAPLDVRSLATWDFLTPWCDELRGRLVVNTDGHIRLMAPAARDEGEEPSQEEKTEEEDDERLKMKHFHTREAWELLVLVARLDMKVFQMLLRKKCALRFDGPGIFTHEEDDDDDDDDDEGGKSGDTAEETFQFKCKRDRDEFILPQLAFINLLVRIEDSTVSVVDEWKWLFLGKSVGYEPSAANLQTKARILAMPFRIRPPIPRSIEVPVSIQLQFSSCGDDVSTRCLLELRELIDAMKLRSQQLEAENSDMETHLDNAQTFSYRMVKMSLYLTSFRLAGLGGDRLLAVLGAGVPIETLNLHLPEEARGDRNQVASREAFAKFFTGLLIRPPEQVPSISTLEICHNDKSSWQFPSLCSALAVSRTPIDKLRLSGIYSPQKRREQWKLVAKTLFHTRFFRSGAYSSVRGYEFDFPGLQTEDVEAIFTTVHENEAQKFCRTRWSLREGTLVQLVEESTARPSGCVRLSSDTTVELVDGRQSQFTVDMAGYVNVVVPAYGLCRVDRQCLADAMAEGTPLSSLLLHLSSENPDDVVYGVDTLLNLIGWSLQHLGLVYFAEMDEAQLVYNILKACPRLTSLAIRNVPFIRLDRFASGYERFSAAAGPEGPTISKLALEKVDDIGPDHGQAFMARLGDPTSYLAQYLRELVIHTADESEALDDTTFSALFNALRNNTKLEKITLHAPLDATHGWKKRLRQFHGQLLPPLPLPRVLKLAFLSAIYPNSEGENNTSLAAHRVDRRALSLVFEFAATRVIRSVAMDDRS